MKIITDIQEMKNLAAETRAKNKSIGFVPTMGFLHSGHLSLVRASVERSDVAVVSIFVNPAQFAPQEDFKRYPRDLNRDYRLLEAEGVDYVFVPAGAEMYPEGFSTYVQVEKFQDRLCGLSRPGHFRGVCTVVLKLFNIVQPDLAFFGQKDAQQVVILKKMVEDLDVDTRIEALPIVREPDGLALSSRNTYLDPEQRIELDQLVQKAEENLFYTKIDDHGLLEKISKQTVEAEFTAGSFPYRLLTNLIAAKDFEALQTAYELLQEQKR